MYNLRVPEVFRKKINDTLPEWQDVHLPKGGSPKTELSPIRILWVTSGPRAGFPAEEDYRVMGVDVTEKYNLAFEDNVG